MMACMLCWMGASALAVDVAPASAVGIGQGVQDHGDTEISDEDRDEGEGDEEDEDEPIVIVLRPPREHIPSALDETAGDPLGEAPASARRSLRSTAFVRPRVASVLRLGDSSNYGVGLGVMVGQRWWDLAPRFVSWGGENTFRAEGLAGGLGGFRLVGTSLTGPWIGRLGVRAGPQVELSRIVAGDEELAMDLMLGGMMTVGVDLGSVSPWIGVATSWDALGKRERAAGATIGTETSWIMGTAFSVGFVSPRVELRLRMTELGAIGTGVVGVQFRPPPRARDDDADRRRRIRRRR